MSDTISQIRVLLDRAAQLRDRWRQHQERGLSASLVTKIDLKRQLLDTFVEIAELTARYSRERSARQQDSPADGAWRAGNRDSHTPRSYM